MVVVTTVMFGNAGIVFVGDTNVTVGENATISCHSDLTVERVEWIFGGDVIMTSNDSQRVDLVFRPVQEFLHNREYTCRAVTAYGILERTITITVYSKQFSSIILVGLFYLTNVLVVPAAALSLSIEPMGDPIAGNRLELLCSATIRNGIRSTPIFTWLDSNGNTVANADGITVGPPRATSLPLEFSLLRSSQSGSYTCSITLFSLALQVPLNITTSINLSVQSRLFWLWCMMQFDV